MLNRFSSDTATADDALPFTLNILLANIFGLVGTVLVLCLSEPYLLLALIPLAILYKYLQTYYRQTARELRRLNSIARSATLACMQRMSFLTNRMPLLLALHCIALHCIALHCIALLQT